MRRVLRVRMAEQVLTARAVVLLQCGLHDPQPQVAVYCGMPAGLDSTRIAREAFAEVDAAGA